MARTGAAQLGVRGPGAVAVPVGVETRGGPTLQWPPEFVEMQIPRPAHPEVAPYGGLGLQREAGASPSLSLGLLSWGTGKIRPDALSLRQWPAPGSRFIPELGGRHPSGSLAGLNHKPGQAFIFVDRGAPGAGTVEETGPTASRHTVRSLSEWPRRTQAPRTRTTPSRFPGS